MRSGVTKLERKEIERTTKILWQLNDPVYGSKTGPDEKKTLVESLIHQLCGNEFGFYLTDCCCRSKSFSISDFIRFLHERFGTIPKPEFKEDHPNNEIFSKDDQEFLLGFFIGFHESKGSDRFKINSGVIKGWKRIHRS